jgi:hypothetical protein
MAQAVVTNLLPRGFWFALYSFDVVFVVDKVAMGQVFHQVLLYSHFSCTVINSAAEFLRRLCVEFHVVEFVQLHRRTVF